MLKKAKKMLKSAGSSADQSQALAALQCYGQLQKSLESLAGGKGPQQKRARACPRRSEPVVSVPAATEIETGMRVAMGNSAGRPKQDAGTQDNFLLPPTACSEECQR